jgi:hypothetical protein
MHREKPHKLLQVGVTPTPATIYIWEVIRLPDCKSGVAKQAGSDDWSVTSISHHFGLVAQSEEQPVVCGKAEGASPFGSANFRAYREADSQGFGIAFLQSSVS